MRIAIFAVFLSSGLAAFGQWPSPIPSQPNQTWVISPEDQKPGQETGGALPGLKFKFDPSQTLILPKTVEIPSMLKAQIDPKMIVHPRKSGIGEQAPGTFVAQNLYPGLQLLPVGGSKGKVEPIPITWPKMKVEDIPTACPDCKMVLVGNGTNTTPAGK
jgi:hypothetical protein